MRPLLLVACLLTVLSAGQVAALDLAKDAGASLFCLAAAGDSDGCVSADVAGHDDTLSGSADSDGGSAAGHCGGCCLHHNVGHLGERPAAFDPGLSLADLWFGNAAPLRSLPLQRLPKPPRT